MRGPLFLVADGMGGAAAGEIASTMCTEAFADARPDPAARRRRAALGRSASANASIHEPRAGGSRAGRHGHDRDRRAGGRRRRQGRVRPRRRQPRLPAARRRLQRLSEDHSVVAELVAAGQLTEEEASSHPQRSVITRVLGAEPTVEVDAFTSTATAGRRRAALQRRPDGDGGRRADRRAAGGGDERRGAVRSLVRAALDGGGEDNVTAIVFRLDRGGRRPHRADAHDPDDRPRPADDRRRRRTAARPPRAVRRPGRRRRGRAADGRRRRRPAREPLHRRRRVDRAASRSTRACRGSSFVGIKLYHAGRGNLRSPTPRSHPQTRKQLFDHRLRSLSSAQEASRAGSRPGTREVGPRTRAVEPDVGRGADRHRLPGGVHRPPAGDLERPRWSTPGSSSACTRSRTSACGPACRTPTPGCCRWRR